VADTTANPRARTLAAALRRARTEAGFGVREVARTLNMSHTTISQWETGKRVPALADLTAMLIAIGLPEQRQQHLIDLARDLLPARRQNPATYLDGVLECERSAAEIVEWSPLAIPDLLQTAAYATEVIGDDDALTRAEVQARVERRLSRRAALGADYTALIGEWALRQRVGGVAVQVEQLKRIVKGSLPVRVVPIGAGWHPGLAGPFTLYHFADASSVAYLPHRFLYDDAEVTPYKIASARLRRLALDEADSATFVTTVIKKLEKSAARRSPGPKQGAAARARPSR
jgi:transcriptional regulator with XRE-family HTH domain